MARSAGGIRDRFRSQMRQEVKDAALRQLAKGGPQALSVNAIAKELGVSGPALYRYFAGREALLTELILDAYADLTAAVAAAPPTVVGLADAYRAWAVAQPHRYRLLFSAPLPGYDADEERLVAAQRAMNAVFGAQMAADPGSPRGEPGVQGAADLSRALAGIIAWSRLHGIVSLEIEGNFASIGLDADRLFAREVAALGDALSSPAQ